MLSRGTSKLPGEAQFFFATLSDLQTAVWVARLPGTWDPEPNNGCHSFRYQFGGGVHWSSTTGRIWVDGPYATRRVLQQFVDDLVRRQSPNGRPESPTSPF